jgi:hypothetical protein
MENSHMRSAFLFLIIVLSSNQAWGSKARLQALGQSENGSYHVMDARNMFLNPATIGSLAEQVNLEWGSSNRPSDPNAEGGFVQNVGAGKLGLYLGRELALTENVRALNSTTVPFATLEGAIDTAFGTDVTLPEPTNTVEAIFGVQSGGMLIGGALAFGRNKDENGTNLNDETQAIELRGGVATTSFDGHLRMTMGAKSEDQLSATNTVEYEGSLGLRAGGGLSIGPSLKLIGEFNYDTFELANSTNTAEFDGTFTRLRGGVVQTREIDKGARFFSSLEFALNRWDLKGKNGTATGKVETTSLPIVVGIEADAATWLKLRGSVAQSIIIDETKTKSGTDDTKDQHAPNSTTVAAGGGVTLNKFTLDGTFGGSTAGTLNANNVFANVSLNYTF